MMDQRTSLFSIARVVVTMFVFGAASISPAYAQLQGTQTQGTIAPIPVAVPLFLGDDAQLAGEISDVVQADLERSGLFQPLDRASFLEQVRDVNAAPRFPDWRSIKADALVVGRVVKTGDGKVGAEFRLWDVVSGKQLAGQRFSTAQANWRRIGHLIADQVYERLTGEKGYFDTRVVYIDETGPKDKRTKRLAIMDQDGANVRLLSQGQELVLTPRFSPTNQEITYMSYTRDQPKVFIMNLETGQRELVGDFPGMTFAPRFSPDGQRVVMSLGTPDGESSIYELDLRSRQSRRLTQSGGIDTGPSYSPDGRQIVFESDREGSQQLYVMNADGSGVRRITNGDGRYSTPVWSPRGDYIAFTKQTSGRFLIGVMKPDGSGERVLTEGYHNEGPTWAPNGRVLMFFRESQGASGGPKIHSVDITGYNERQVATPAFGSDPAWSPLLN
ncbi:MAG: Tol-Pal system beta propeller repeat protein TolB [Hyphomicrobium sp.]|nr:MAG: Tol-Pal system beta propeller repeat protein TolB [Hyphomicrobium sp.]PPD01673.1 MAG: Tol-Pal system beta propeller repeat protein TolB [Hyphomicrobium sp.]